MKTSAENFAALQASPEYAAATASYSNAFRNGAGRQGPGTWGFALWLLYDIHCKAHGRPPSSKDAIKLAKDHGLNETSAVNALGKWAAYNGFRPPRTGAYAQGPRS